MDKKRYPKMNLSTDQDTPQMLAWLAGVMTTEERRKISPSEVVRRLVRAEYERRGGPPLEDDDSDSHAFAA